MNEVTLSPESVKAIARQLAEVIGPMLGIPVPRAVDTDPLFDRSGAADYLKMAVSTFDHERKKHPETLKPAGECGPMSRRWLKSTLDRYKYGARAFVRTRRKRTP